MKELSNGFTGRVKVSPSGTVFAIWLNRGTGREYGMDKIDVQKALYLCEGNPHQAETLYHLQQSQQMLQHNGVWN